MYLQYNTENPTIMYIRPVHCFVNFRFRFDSEIQLLKNSEFLMMIILNVKEIL